MPYIPAATFFHNTVYLVPKSKIAMMNPIICDILLIFINPKSFMGLTRI